MGYEIISGDEANIKKKIEEYGNIILFTILYTILYVYVFQYVIVLDNFIIISFFNFYN